MKRLFAIVAMVVIISAFMACSPSQEEIASKARYIAEQSVYAELSRDWILLEQITKEERDFCAKLNDEDLLYYKKQVEDAEAEFRLEYM